MFRSKFFAPVVRSVLLAVSVFRGPAQAESQQLLATDASATVKVGAEAWHFKQQLLPVLVEAVPRILDAQDKTTGRFGSGIWVSGDQTVIFPLAAAWALKDGRNRFYHDADLLEAIMHGGDALAAAQDKQGRWVFQKKDGSTWGMHFNPWMYSRWARAYSLIRDSMPPERRERWRKALELGFTGIEKHELPRIHNIPAHQAMGLYIAGKALGHPEWCHKAAVFLESVAAAQDKNGFWSEHVGPVVNYNFVYVDALGTYYALSRDEKVLPALQRADRFHANFTYPDGTCIETIDERNPYTKRVVLPNVGFAFSAEGRAFFRAQMERIPKSSLVNDVDIIASWLLYADEAPLAAKPASANSTFTMEDGKAAVIKSSPWCAVLSAYTCPVFKSRWIQDRQNLVSLCHEKTGLILGGGNTKLQPLWSTFTVGDTSLLKQRPGDENPDFAEPAGLIHVATQAELQEDRQILRLKYGDALCKVTLQLSPNSARLTYEVESAPTLTAVQAHVPLLPAFGGEWHTASGKTGKLGTKALKLTARQSGPWFEHNGWRVEIPANSILTWPVLPHNPYRKDGRAEPPEGRVVLTLPFSEKTRRQEITVNIRADR